MAPTLGTEKSGFGSSSSISGSETLHNSFVSLSLSFPICRWGCHGDKVRLHLQKSVGTAWRVSGLRYRCVLFSGPQSCMLAAVLRGVGDGRESGHLFSPGLLSSSPSQMAQPSLPIPDSTPHTLSRERSYWTLKEALIDAATGIFCQGPDPVSTPSLLRWHQYHLSSHFQLRNCAH